MISGSPWVQRGTALEWQWLVVPGVVLRNSDPCYRYSVSMSCTLMQHGEPCTERVSVRAGKSTNVLNSYLSYFSYLKSILLQIRCIILNICLWAYQESHQNVQHAFRSSTWRCVKYSYCQWYSFGIRWERFHQRYEVSGGRFDDHSVLIPYLFKLLRIGRFYMRSCEVRGS